MSLISSISLNVLNIVRRYHKNCLKHSSRDLVISDVI